jgi:hypothetical protein
MFPKKCVLDTGTTNGGNRNKDSLRSIGTGDVTGLETSATYYGPQMTIDCPYKIYNLISISQLLTRSI